MRVRTRSVAGALLFLLASLHALAAADLRLTPSFDPADPARSWVDVGGTWDGSAEVSATTGDGFGITAFNAPGAVPDPLTDTAYDLQLSVTLPVGFLYVDGTVAGDTGA